MSTQLHDFKNQALAAAGAYPGAVTTTDVGASVDLGEADGRCFAIQMVGAVSGTTPSLAGKIQESSDNSTFSDVSNAAFTAVTAANDLQVITFDRTKRYVRYARTVSGTTPSFTLAVLIGEQKKTV